MSWSILPELSAWHAASLMSRGFEGVRADVSEGIAPLIARIGPENIASQIAALGNSDSTTLNESFELYDTIRAIVPLDEELRTRVGPIRQQWEARGPGMLSELRRHIVTQLSDLPVTFNLEAPAIGASESVSQQVKSDPSLCSEGDIPATIQILPVYPWAGGFVEPLPASNAILVEAVLTDIDSRLPESVRLAWAHAQLYSRTAFAQNRAVVPSAVHALATIMPTLAAADHVELVKCDADTAGAAIRLWLNNEPMEEAVSTLTTWWNEWSRQLSAGACDWTMAVSAIGA